MKSKKTATYVKKSFVMMKMIKIDSNYTKKSEIIAITEENLEELLIAFAIEDTKYLKKFIMVQHMIIIL